MALTTLTQYKQPWLNLWVMLDSQIEKAALIRIIQALETNVPARAVPLNEEEMSLVRTLQLLTLKPQVYAANVGEADLADGGACNPYVAALKEKAAEENCDVIIVSAQVRLRWSLSVNLSLQLRPGNVVRMGWCTFLCDWGGGQ